MFKNDAHADKVATFVEYLKELNKKIEEGIFNFEEKITRWILN